MKSLIVTLLSSMILQALSLGDEGVVLPLGTSDLVPDSRVEEYQSALPKIEVAHWTMDSAEIEYEGQHSNAASMIPFKIIKDEMGEGDRLQIVAVQLMDSEKLEIGSTIQVFGTYTLGSVDDARLGLSISSTEKSGRHQPALGEMVDISKGRGSFKLLRKVDRNGGIHLSIYPKEASGRYGQSTSRLYFLELEK